MHKELQHNEISARLLRSIATLKQELHSLLEEWFSLEKVCRPKLTAEYDALFHDLETEIQRKTLEAAEIARKVELLGLKKQRGELITSDTTHLVDTIVAKEFERMRQRLHEVFDKPPDERNPLSARKISDDEFPKMYRAIVKKLHPDISESSDAFRKYWNSVQTAYETKNKEQMQVLFHVLADDEVNSTRHFVGNMTDISALESKEKELRQKVERERRKIQKLHNEEPFILSDLLKNTLWIAAQRKNLEDQINRKKKEISCARTAYSSLTGEEYSFKEENISIKNQIKSDVSDDNFIDATYFGNR